MHRVEVSNLLHIHDEGADYNGNKRHQMTIEDSIIIDFGICYQM